ncbi:MAG: four helix bundle protein [Bacteroidaceae bacterium]|nr:four helix bundle protein [Bacteroidaceae bacterium]
MAFTDIEQNPTYNKSLDFAVRIVRLCNYLQDDKHEYLMSKQLLRCGTSIGANYSEAVGAESNEDFIHKCSISLKESNETKYWLTLLYKTGYLTDMEYNSVIGDCQEIRAILAAIIQKCKQKQKS